MVATYEQIDNTCLQIIGRVATTTTQGAVLQLLYNTGLRIQEAIELERFTLTPTTFVVDTEKKSLNREFDLSLLPYLYLSSVPYVPSPFNVPTFGSYSNTIRTIQATADRIYYKGKNNIMSNIFRYRYARYLEQQGYTVQQIRDAFGHLSLQSTMSYLAPIMY